VIQFLDSRTTYLKSGNMLGKYDQVDNRNVVMHGES